MRKTLAFVAAGAAALLGTAEAQAGDFLPWFAASRAGGYIDFWPAEHSTSSLFGAELQLRVANRVFLDMSFSGALSQVDFLDNGDVNAAYGNPTFGAHYVLDVSPKVDFFVGGTFTPPVLHDPATDVYAASLYPSVIRGFYDLDRMVVAHFAIRAMGGFEWNFLDPLYLRGELRPVVYVPTRDTLLGFGVRNEADFILEHYVEFEGRLKNGFGAGARLQGVILVSNDRGDQAQLLMEPFIAITPRRTGFYMRLGFPLALDEPLGFGFDEDRLAAIRISLGGQF